MNEIEERLRGDLFTATYDMEGDLEPDKVLAAAHTARRVRTGRRIAGVAGVAVIATVALLALPGHLPGAGPVASTPAATSGSKAPKVRISPGLAENAANQTRPEIPGTAGAMDLDRYGSAQFSSPSGRIWCDISADSAACGFPDGMDMAAVPKAKDTCASQDLEVLAVSVGTKGSAGYACGAEPVATPLVDSVTTTWWTDTGYPSVETQSGELAVLPYGKKVTLGSFVCFSENTGVTCGNTDSGKGFKVSRAGVLFIG